MTQICELVKAKPTLFYYRQSFSSFFSYTKAEKRLNILLQSYYPYMFFWCIGSHITGEKPLTLQILTVKTD
jgi:hypothetical protein